MIIKITLLMAILGTILMTENGKKLSIKTTIGLVIVMAIGFKTPVVRESLSNEVESLKVLFTTPTELPEAIQPK